MPDTAGTVVSVDLDCGDWLPFEVALPQRQTGNVWLSLGDVLKYKKAYERGLKRKAPRAARSIDGCDADMREEESDTEAPIPKPAPSANPAPAPSVDPAPAPSVDPAPAPSVHPVATPSVDPAAAPSVHPVATPSVDPAAAPSVHPVATPSVHPAAGPTMSHAPNFPRHPFPPPPPAGASSSGYPGYYPGGYPGGCFPGGYFPGGQPGCFPAGYPGYFGGGQPTYFQGPGCFQGGYPGCFQGGYPPLPGYFPPPTPPTAPGASGFPHSGGYSGNPGGYSGNPGGYSGNPGGYSGNPGGYSGNPGGYSGNPGGYSGGNGAPRKEDEVSRSDVPTRFNQRVEMEDDVPVHRKEFGDYATCAWADVFKSQKHLLLQSAPKRRRETRPDADSGDEEDEGDDDDCASQPKASKSMFVPWKALYEIRLSSPSRGTAAAQMHRYCVCRFCNELHKGCMPASGRMACLCCCMAGANDKKGRGFCIACKEAYHNHENEKDYHKRFVKENLMKPLEGKLWTFKVKTRGECRTIGSAASGGQEKRMDIFVEALSGSSTLNMCIEHITTAEMTKESKRVKRDWLLEKAGSLSSNKSVLLLLYNKPDMGLVQMVLMRAWITLFVEEATRLPGANSVFEMTLNAPDRIRQEMPEAKHYAWNAVPHDPEHEFRFFMHHLEEPRIKKYSPLAGSGLAYVDFKSVFV